MNGSHLQKKWNKLIRTLPQRQGFIPLRPDQFQGNYIADNEINKWMSVLMLRRTKKEIMYKNEGNDEKGEQKKEAGKGKGKGKTYDKKTSKKKEKEKKG